MATALDKITGRSRDFKKVFLGSEEGRRVLGHIYKMCGMNRQTFVPMDAHATSFNTGKHRIGQGIQSILSQEEKDMSEILKSLDSQEMVGADTIAFDPFNQNKGE